MVTSLTMSQAEVPLEWLHAFYWEMGLFIPPFAILKPKVERGFNMMHMVCQ